tara:strand:+ start:600 stop:1019 length:420 start_codon:yes stop_codon:yes gene_type:complete
MSVRIVRLKNGEDIICDLFEVSTKEYPDKIIAFQLKNPYNISMLEPEMPMIIGDEEDEQLEDEIRQLNPDIDMRPWAPLCESSKMILKMEDILTAYETYPEIITKYNELVEAANGRVTGKIDPTKGPPGVFDRDSDTTG